MTRKNSLQNNGSQKRPPLESSVAGSWYPGTAAALDALLDRCLSAVPAKEAAATAPNILVLPHAGYAYSAQTAAFAIKPIAGAQFKRVVLLAPSHRVYINEGAVAPEADAVATPYGEIPVDEEAIAVASRRMPVLRSDGIHANEHSAQILYPLLQYALRDFKIAPLIVGSPSPAGIRRIADALRPLMDADTLLVISSDFTHYGDDFDHAPFGAGAGAREKVQEIDAGAFEAIKSGSFERFMDYIDSTGATICGRTPIAIMLAMLPKGAQFEMEHYETSSDESRDFSRFVCYMAITGHADWNAPSGGENGDFLSGEDKRALLRFARASIKHTLDTRELLPGSHFADEATPAMSRKMGCFVTLNMKDGGDLRGCIGEIVARRPLYSAVTELAVHSAFGDSRFPPLGRDEFDKIEIEISALTPERAVGSWREIEIGRHGMTVHKRGRSAVFLPQVAPEQGWTLEETLSHLSLKAGLRADDWRAGADFTVFEAIVFGEREFC